ncbi:hypothetical protein ABE10_01165, partial [Bacillus toyonensis]|nr:hypothetical protein [Bacillus toyonensis]
HLGVARLDLALGAADRAGDQAGLDRLIVREVGAGQDRLGRAGLEQAHEVVGEAEVETALPRVTLTTGAAAQLIVDAARLVALGAEHVESSGLGDLGAFLGDLRLHRLIGVVPRGLVLLRRLDRIETLRLELLHGEELRVASEHDVGASAGHVRGDRDSAETSGASDDLRLARMVLRVQDLMPDALLGEETGEVLALLDAHGADQDRLPVRVALGDVLDDLGELRRLVLVHEVGVVLADHRLVGRDLHDAELVGRHELRRLGVRRAGHAGELVVEAEVVLQGDGGESLVLCLDRDVLLGLDRLVDALVVTPSDEDATGVLVHDHDLVVHHDVVGVTFEEGERLDRVVEEGDEGRVRGLVEVVDAEVVLDLLDAGLEHADRALLLVDLVVLAGLERACDLRELGEPAVRLA